MQQIGQRMKELREANKMSQAEIAKLCGSNQATIAKMESGKTLPSVKVLLCMADYFDVSMDYLCCRTEQKQGKLYDGTIKFRVKEQAIQQFIDMCFDPQSPVSGRVKESLKTILEEESK